MYALYVWRPLPTLSNSKHTENSFSLISTDSVCLQHAQMPKIRDLVIFVPTTTNRQTDYFTPCAHACRVNYMPLLVTCVFGACSGSPWINPMTHVPRLPYTCMLQYIAACKSLVVHMGIGSACFDMTCTMLCNIIIMISPCNDITSVYIQLQVLGQTSNGMKVYLKWY